LWCAGILAAHRIMKITTKISFGYGLFIAILTGLVIYQVITINKMQSINKKLKEINFENAITLLDAMKQRDRVWEFSRKCFASPDPRYPEELNSYINDYEKDLSDIAGRALSVEEQNSLNRLRKSWNAFASNLQSELRNKTSEVQDPPAYLMDELDGLEAQMKSFFNSTLKSITEKVESSESRGRTAEGVLYSAAALSLAISILVSFLIYLSISKPLLSLTEGTRAIAEGKFFYRLDTTRKDELSQLAKDFNTMTHRLNELDELKKDFVSHVSHEMKAPLASMRETIQLLLEEIPGPLTEKQRRLLQLNLQSGIRLTSMISNLLDISKTEAGVMEYELKHHDLVPLVRNAIAEFDVQAEERKIRIDAELPNESLPVQCDSDRIVQVLVNLVGNAVKFSSKGGSVHVKVEAVERIPENVPDNWRRLIAGADDGKPFGLISITDTGPGIPDSDKEKIFEKFHQIKRGKKVAGQGVGLGLAICRTIIQAHRGAIWAEDNPAGGSRFVVLLRPGQEGEEVIPQASVPI
jgi:signal transduction histidine kinase